MRNITPHQRIYDDYFGILKVFTEEELPPGHTRYMGAVVGGCGESCSLCETVRCDYKNNLYSVYVINKTEYVAVFNYVVDNTDKDHIFECASLYLVPPDCYEE